MARVLSGPWKGREVRERIDPHHYANVVAARRGIYRPARRLPRYERRLMNFIAYASWVIVSMLVGWFAAQAF